MGRVTEGSEGGEYDHILVYKNMKLSKIKKTIIKN